MIVNFEELIAFVRKLVADCYQCDSYFSYFEFFVNSVQSDNHSTVVISSAKSLQLQTLRAVLVICFRINALYYCFSRKSYHPRRLRFRLKFYHKFSAMLILFVTTVESTNIVETRLIRDHDAAKAAQVIRNHKMDRRSSTNQGSYDGAG